MSTWRGTQGVRRDLSKEPSVIEVDSSPDFDAGERARTVDIDALLAVLGDEKAARPAADFPWGMAGAYDDAGLYSWRVDAAGADMLSEGLGPRSTLASSTGARPEPRRGRAVRDGRRLCSGGSGETTFVVGPPRRLFASPSPECSPVTLGLAAGGTFGPEDEAALRAWVDAHLRVTAAVLEDRDALSEGEGSVLTALDPPLNLAGMELTLFRRRLRELRSSVEVRVRNQS